MTRRDFCFYVLNALPGERHTYCYANEERRDQMAAHMCDMGYTIQTWQRNRGADV
jgi:hypothetical protein